MIIEKHVGEKHGNLTIICPSIKPSNGYLHYYWVKCDCGNIRRYRYDRIKQVGDCGMCEDFKESGVNSFLGVQENDKE